MSTETESPIIARIFCEQCSAWHFWCQPCEAAACRHIIAFVQAKIQAPKSA